MCELKKVYVSINNTYESFDADYCVEQLKENLKDYNIDVTILRDEFLQDEIKNCVVIGDSGEDIGLGKEYRGHAKYLVYDVADIDYDYLNMVWSRKHNIPLVIASTKRLLIREMKLDDLDQMYELYDSLKECEYVEQLCERKKQEKSIECYIRYMYSFYNYGLWLVFEKSSGKLIGRAGLENILIDGNTHVQLGYIIDKRYWGMNYAYESCCEILEYAKNQLFIDTVYTCINKNNYPSIKLAGKLGFKIYKTFDTDMNIYFKHL